MIASVLDIFSIGVGPSSSHTVGPMRAAGLFVRRLAEQGVESIGGIRVELFGALGLTGRGHGADLAIVCGLEGFGPEEVDPDHMQHAVEIVRQQGGITLSGGRLTEFDVDRDLIFHHEKLLSPHPNTMRFSARDATGRELLSAVYYSVGGGVVTSAEDGEPNPQQTAAMPYPFGSAADLLRHCRRDGVSISRLVLENEKTRQPEAAVRARLDRIWEAMQDSVRRGCNREGLLPGGLGVRRRAPRLMQELTRFLERSMRDPLAILDWVCMYALAVSEENAGGGRIVTAPTNGAAGIVPAALHYYARFCPAADAEGIAAFLLTAAAIGALCRDNASICGAEVGCQGEVGVACSMAAAGLTEVLGGTVEQVENAAEIALEHNLGLTCDPVAGLVQIPCIERNAMGAIKALGASRLALRGDGAHHVSLDAAIATMRRTGFDMPRQYKETAQGGLALHDLVPRVVTSNRCHL